MHLLACMQVVKHRYNQKDFVQYFPLRQAICQLVQDTGSNCRACKREMQRARVRVEGGGEGGKERGIERERGSLRVRANDSESRGIKAEFKQWHNE